MLEALYRLSLHYQRIYGLTDMEVLVLQQLMLGRSDKEIAESLGNALKTVKNHTVHIRRKMEANSRTHILAIVIQNLLDK